MKNIGYGQRMRASLKTIALAGALSGSVAAGPAIAGDYDGVKPLICAALVAVSCQSSGNCKQGTVESLNIPQFFYVDVAAKTIGERDPDGQIRSSSIQTVNENPKYLILQGSKDNLGWNGTISKSSGKLTLTGSDGLNAMVVYGACTPAK